MNSKFQYLDKPPLPTELISEVYSSLDNPNMFGFQESTNYQLFDASVLLKEYTKSIFDFKHETRVQKITKDLVRHKDVNRTLAYNYILDLGGSNVETCFYNDQLQLTESVIIEANRWHVINVDVYHNVKNVTGSRIALTVHIPLK